MNLLILGSGGREHALAWKLAQSPHVKTLYAIPGNPGIARHAHCVPGELTDFNMLVRFAQDREIDLTVVGPEAPLAAGLVDRFMREGRRIFGPTAAAAQIEASKAFAKELMQKYDIPTARYAAFTESKDAIEYIREHGAPIVVKADGLAAGKGVTVAQSVDDAIAAVEDAMEEGVFGPAGERVIIEECLDGEEASVFALSDGKNILPLAACQDHKAALDNDEGPNTGGMGAYSPAPIVSDEQFEEIRVRVLQPMVDAMADEGHPYVGVLYAGVMMTSEGFKVIEFNCRFGDPETQVLLPRMKSDLLPILDACCDGTLHQHSVTWDPRACVTVVMASKGYPGDYQKGKIIEGLDAFKDRDDVLIFHAGTARREGKLLSAGGRVLNITALGDDIPDAIDRAYKAVGQISFEGAHYRTDIGRKAVQRLKSS